MLNVETLAEWTYQIHTLGEKQNNIDFQDYSNQAKKKKSYGNGRPHKHSRKNEKLAMARDKKFAPQGQEEPEVVLPCEIKTQEPSTSVESLADRQYRIATDLLQYFGGTIYLDPKSGDVFHNPTKNQIQKRQLMQFLSGEDKEQTNVISQDPVFDISTCPQSFESSLDMVVGPVEMKPSDWYVVADMAGVSV